MVGRRAVRSILLLIAAGVLASCSSSGPAIKFGATKEYFGERTYGAASPRVVAYGAVPRGGGRALVGDPYRVAGKTYVPTDNPRYSETGLASWYGAAFHGRLTANGEVYDVNGLTAAHPTLPLPSYVRVTNLENGRSMIVRVNDRGPFAHDRIIDVSEKVAGMLGFEDEGTAHVRVDYMGPAQMDGLDRRTLLASYRDPSGGGNGGLGSGLGSLFAWTRPAPAPTFRVAAATQPPPQARPAVLTTTDQAAASATGGPLVLIPGTVAAAPNDDDPLAPLIMRSTFVSSYASDPPATPAQRAAAGLAATADTNPALQAALDRVAARRANEIGPAPLGSALVQLGSFSDPTNAIRVAAQFRRFGSVENDEQQVNGQAMTVVRIAVAKSIDPGTVVEAANAAGLTGAYILAQ